MARRRAAPGLGLKVALDHAVKVVEGLPAFEPWLGGMRALGMDPDGDAARIEALRATGELALGEVGAAHRRLAAGRAEAEGDAVIVLAWTKAVRRHLRAAESQGDATAGAAAREVRPLLELGRARFRGALEELRRVVPALRDRAAWLEVYQGGAAARTRGEELLAQLEARETELVVLDNAAESADARCAEAQADLQAAIEGFEASWKVAEGLVEGHPRWPFGRKPWGDRRVHRNRGRQGPEGGAAARVEADDVHGDADAPADGDAAAAEPDHGDASADEPEDDVPVDEPDDDAA